VKRKIVVIFVTLLLILLIPNVSAETVHLSGTVRFERGNFTANNTIPLNLSNEEELKEYSPVYRFWPSSDHGILVDSTLPPDILSLENGTVDINGTFRLSSRLSAYGASKFVFRLPVACNIDSISYIEMKIYHGAREIEDFKFNWDLLRSRGEPLSKYNVTYYNITYIGYNLTLIYLTLRTMILSDITYNYTLHIDQVRDGYLLAAGFDLFGDNVTGFTVNGEHYDGDAMAGIKILDMVSNGYGEFHIPYMQKEFSLDDSYNGPRYVSFTIGIVSRGAQNVTVRITSLDGSGVAIEANSTRIFVNDTGPVMIYGHVKINMSSTSAILVTLYSDGDMTVITDGEDTYPITPDSTLLTKSLVEVQSSYLSWYMDIAVSTSEYVYPYFVRLPGTWEENVALIFKTFGAEALIPVAISGLYMGLAAMAVINFTLHMMFMPYIIVGNILKSLIDAALAGFMWFVEVPLSLFMDAVQYALWVLELIVTTVLNVLFWLLAAVLGNAMVNAFVRFPKEGVNAIFEEFGRGLSVVNQMMAPARFVARKVAGVIK